MSVLDMSVLDIISVIYKRSIYLTIVKTVHEKARHKP